MSDKIIKLPQIRFAGFTDAWEQRELVDIVEFFSGLTYSPENVIEDGGTFVLRSSNVKNGEIVDADNVYVESDIVNSDNVQVGDVIVVVRNGSRDLIGKHAQIKKQMNNTVIGAFMTGLRSETPNFTNAMLDTQQFSIEITKNLGATINQITTSAFKKMEFYIPVETAEREQVGTFFAQLDNLITLHQRKLELLKGTKNGLLQKMFPKDGGNVPEIRFAGFTDAWEQHRLGEMLEERNEQIPENEEYSLMSFVQGTGVTPKVDRYDRSFLVKDVNKKYKKTELGDFIYSSNNLETGSIGFNKTGKAVISPVYSVFSSKNKMESQFIGILSTRKDFIGKMLQFRQGVVYGQWRIHEKDFLDIQITVPSHDEQKEIIGFFVNLDNLITLHRRELNLIKNLKKSLLQQMFI